MSSFDSAPPTARLNRAEVEVGVPPEVVWEAIATATGSSGWLFPTDIEGHEGGTVVVHRAPFGGDAVAKVVAWQPPHRFAYEEGQQGGPAWITELLVEARSGGTCVVRVVNGMLEGAEGWEDLIDGAGEGWRYALEILKVYVTHFAGEPGVALNGTLDTGRPLAERAELSAELLAEVGLTGVQVGDEVQAPTGAPRLVGVVEMAGEHGVLVRATEPYPAVFEIDTFSMNGETVTVNVCAHVYGPDNADHAARDERAWNDWLAARFSTPVAPA